MQLDTDPITNMPPDCYEWGTLVVFKSTHSRLLMYVENSQTTKVWVTNQWGSNDFMPWRAL